MPNKAGKSVDEITKDIGLPAKTGAVQFSDGNYRSLSSGARPRKSRRRS